MKKIEQIFVNQQCKDALQDLENCIIWFGETKIGKLRSCKADVYTTNGYTFLKSYNTIVACIGHNDNVCYDVLRLVYGYSATSSQHISKFVKDYEPEKVLTYRPI